MTAVAGERQPAIKDDSFGRNPKPLIVPSSAVSAKTTRAKYATTRSA